VSRPEFDVMSRILYTNYPGIMIMRALITPGVFLLRDSFLISREGMLMWVGTQI
jgi:hypothetical protein